MKISSNLMDQMSRGGGKGDEGFGENGEVK